MRLKDFEGAHGRSSKGSESPWVARALFVIASSWTFQGVLYMDRTERIFKLASEVLYFALFFCFLQLISNWQTASIGAVVLAHSANFLTNGQLPVALKNLGLTGVEPVRFMQYAADLGIRAEASHCISAMAIFGSRVRGTMTESSDLDVRLLRERGFLNGLCACLFVAKERRMALLRLFPLDIYVLDTTESLCKISACEKPEIVYDNKSTISKWYGK